MTKKSSIQLSVETKNKLALLSYKSQTYEETINELITLNFKFTNEKQFSEWFKKNYEVFGFERILEEKIVGTPDFIMEKNNKEVKIELETLSSNFIRHGHKIEDVDLVICLKKDKNLPVKTIEIKAFDFIPHMPNAVTLNIKIHSRNKEEANLISRFKKRCIDYDWKIRKALFILMERWVAK